MKYTDMMQKYRELSKALDRASLDSVLEALPENRRPRLFVLNREGERIGLLILKELPEFAFLVLLDSVPGTYSRLTIKFDEAESGFLAQSRQFGVVCACCPIETYGHDEPCSEEAKKEFRREKLADFTDSLARECQQAGVKTVFVRGAKSAKRFGDLGVAIVESINCKERLCERYERKVVDEALSLFGDRSRGVLSA